MFRKASGGFVIVLSLLLMTALAQNESENATLNYSQFIPKWSKGDNWSLELSGLPLRRSVPTRDCYGRVMMTVVQTPADGIANYVIGIAPDGGRKQIFGNKGNTRIFITLHPSDLSLLEPKFVSSTDANDVTITEYPGHTIQGISLGMFILTFPVLSPTNDTNIRYEADLGNGTKAAITNFAGKDALTVFVVRKAWKKEDFLRRLHEEDYTYRLLWKKGDLWWTYQTSLREGRYRAELVSAEPRPTDANSVKAEFAALYGRFEKAKAQGKTIESDELYLDIVGLGKQAVPSIVEKIKAGDKDMVGALSELTGSVSRDATIARSLDWWKGARRWYIPSEK